jgi:hypothetical protein
MSALDRLHELKVRQYPFALVVLIVLAAVVFAAIEPQHWLRAVLVLSGGLGTAGFLRLVCSDEQAGLLRNRGRFFDVTCYWIFAFLTGFFGVVSPGR